MDISIRRPVEVSFVDVQESSPDPPTRDADWSVDGAHPSSSHTHGMAGRLAHAQHVHRCVCRRDEELGCSSTALLYGTARAFVT